MPLPHLLTIGAWSVAILGLITPDRSLPPRNIREQDEFMPR